MTGPDRHISVETLGAWVSGELADELRAAVATHVEACGFCAAEADLAREFFSTPAEADAGPRSARMRAEFARRLATRPARRSESSSRHARTRPPRSRRRWAWVALAASVVFAFIGLRQTSDTLELPTPSGEMRAGESGMGWEIDLTDTGTAWVVDWTGPVPLNGVEVVVEGSEGRELLRRSVKSDTPRIDHREVGAAADGEVLFVRILGLDAEGRLRTSPPWALTAPAKTDHPHGS